MGPMASVRKLADEITQRVFRRVAPDMYNAWRSARSKRSHELDYWKSRAAAEDGRLTNKHYRYFYTDLFDISPMWYTNKRVLDIGCGPRGSLEWADMCSERVGLDPLAAEYLRLGARNHKMRYVGARSEKIPFPNGYFDVVCTFNSLDHVDDYKATISEIKRVTKQAGTLLIIVEVNHPPSPTEPISLGWDFLNDFLDSFTVVGQVRKYEIGDHNIYRQVRNNEFFDSNNFEDRPGILVARLDKLLHDV